MAIDQNDQNNGKNNKDGKNNLNQGSGKPISPQKLAANQRNAQRSTGPRTDEGKAESAKNSYKHGFFARKLFRGGEQASPEGQETTELGKLIWDYYDPVGYLEELLVEKIVCESVRYGRLLGYEQEELGRRHAFFGPAVDRVLRYPPPVPPRAALPPRSRVGRRAEPRSSRPALGAAFGRRRRSQWAQLPPRPCPNLLIRTQPTEP